LARKRSVDELTTVELRQILIERRRAERQARLDRFRKTGRVIQVEPVPVPMTVDSMRSEPLPEIEEERKEQRKSTSRRWLDRLLLLVELAAVVGLVLLVFNGVNLLRNLNQEVAASLEQPTLTPTPLIMAVVLPSGHTPPNAPGGVRPNEAEIPEHLRPLVQSIADLPVPTPGPQQAIRIQIPAIGVDAPIVQGDGWEQLKKGVGQHNNTPDPGDQGNIVLSAHNDVFGEIFRDLDQLEPGDEVILFTSQKTYTYVVQQSQIVEPTFVEVLSQTQEPVVTLISCYPYLVDNQRIVVLASLK
jgi:sortase A